MSDGYLEQVAGELATLALADEARSGDEDIVNKIGEILGSSSQTLQEGFLTAIRVRRAESRARALLAERAIIQGAGTDRLLPDGSEAGSGAAKAQADGSNGDGNEDGIDTSDLENMLNELDRQKTSRAGTAAPAITPSRHNQR